MNFISRTQSRVYIIIQSNNRLTCPGFHSQVLLPMIPLVFECLENYQAAAGAHLSVCVCVCV